MYISGNIVIRKNGHKRIWRIKSERTRNESQKIENGNVNIGWDTLYQIAQALEVSMEELVEGDKYQKKNALEIDGYQHLKESQKKLLKDLAREFLEAGGKECDKS